MKVCVEIDNKTLSLASSILMQKLDNEEEENELNSISERLKSAEEPIVLGIVTEKDYKEEFKPIKVALSLFAISQEFEKSKSKNKM